MQLNVVAGICLLLGCASLPAPAAAAGPPTVCDISRFPGGMVERVGPHLRRAVGGGEVRSGPFTFCAFLYSDPALQPNANHPSRMTAIPGLGWTALWVYHGAPARGVVRAYYGLAPDGLQTRLGYTRLRPGDWGGRLGGGVPLPAGSGPGAPVRLRIKMETPAGTYGAELRFQRVGRGISELRVSPLP